jgi:hypothetical protein
MLPRVIVGMDGPNGRFEGDFCATNGIVQEIPYGTLRAFKKRASMKEAVTDPKPKPYKAVRVWLPDGTRMLGIWTGTKWWSVNGEIKPIKWELEERKKKKTKELMRALPKFG